MDTEIDTRPENLDSKLASSSPSTHSEISTDGDTSIPQSCIPGNEKMNLVKDKVSNSTCEPKAKKRRKQSNPLKCESTTNTMDMPIDDMELTKIEEQEFHQDADLEESIQDSTNVQVDVENLSTSKTSNDEEGDNPENMSQKNILSQMSVMLYGNINCGSNYNSSGSNSGGNVSGSGVATASNGIANLTGHLNKGSLHLLTEMTSPDSGEEVPRTTESKTLFPGFYPQMPPLLPLNPSDFAGELSKLSSVFSQMADMPTQLMQGNISLTSSNRSFITSSGVRVFNPEAYCELCEKEFCNKYFLKTHKANKHGVCSVDTASFPYRTSFKASFPSMPQQVVPQMVENGINNSPDAYCNICQKSFCNKYFLKKHRQNIHGILENGIESSINIPSSIHVPVISSLPTLCAPLGDSKSDDSSLEHTLNSLKNKINGNSSMANMNGFTLSSAGKSKPFLPNKNGKEVKSERFLCDLCNIEFCDKHYLNAHRQNKHGAGVSPKATHEFSEFSEIGKVENAEKLNKTNKVSDDFKNQTCIPCMKNFTSAETFHNHMLEMHAAAIKEENVSSRPHPAVGDWPQGALEKDQPMQLIKKLSSSPESESNDSSTSIFCSLCFIKFKDKSSLFSHVESFHNVGQFGLTNGSSDTNESISGSSHSGVMQCDACPEQFSEKQVLMNHRLKAHGIISPLSEPLNNIDAYHDTMKDIKADYSSFLTDKQRVQSFCRICNKELCNKYFMKTHMLKMHGIDVDKLSAEDVPKVEKGISCDLCQKVLASKSFLKVHKQNVHGVTDESGKAFSPSESSLDSTLLDSLGKKPSDPSSGNSFSSSQAVDGNDSFYSQPKLGVNAESKTFSCEICGEEFTNKLLFQVHLVNKHVNNSESNVTNLCGLIGLSASKLDALSKENEKGAIRNPKSCSCCTPVMSAGNTGAYGTPAESSMFHCHICNISYHHSNHYQHHLSHRDLIAGESKPNSRAYNYSSETKATDLDNHDMDSGGKNRFKSRKFKRFRCSKCDKTFRTRNKCLHHIQMIHKNKKGTVHPTDRLLINEPPHPKKAFSSIPKTNVETSMTALNCLPSEMDDKNSHKNDDSPQPSHLNVPYVLPKNSKDIIMQPFHLTAPKTDGMMKHDVFVPSLVYLPVNKKVSEPVTVAFTLTPA